MIKTKARSCEGKIAHTSKAAAMDHYFSLRRRGATMLHVYKCKFGPHHHVGHKPKPRKRR